MGFIYLMYNKITTRIYIGQTTQSIKDRIRGHFSNEHNIDLKNDIEKYGKDAFEIYQLAECSNDQLNKMEKYYIKLYDSYTNGYNMNEGGSSGYFRVYDESRVISMYKSGKSLNSIQAETGYRWSKINQIITANIISDIEEKHRLNTSINREPKNKALVMLDITGSEIIKTFTSKKEAYNFICNEQCKDISSQNFYARVGIACSTDRICYKHKWRYKNSTDSINKCKDTKVEYANTLDIDKLDKVNIETETISKKPSKDVLQELIGQYSYEAVGGQYGVSGKTVRKWCDSYGIKRLRIKPSKVELLDLLSKYTIKEIAEKFGVQPSTVSWWKKSFNIETVYPRIQIQCVETKRTFDTYKQAGEYMKSLYPYKMDAKYVGYEIKKSIDNKHRLHGYTWIIISSK